VSNITIVDIIDHRHKYGVQVEVVLSRYPKLVFERDSCGLIAFDDCVYQFYGYEQPGPHWKAFGGRKFDIPMADGSVTHADGQWWDVLRREFREDLYSHGLNTVERLHECYVFFGGMHIDRSVVDEWRKHNEPSNNYHKYDKRHKDYGKHRIVSPWADSD